MGKILIVVSILLLTSCQQKIEYTKPKVMDISYDNPINKNVMVYTTDSLEDALSSLPFSLKLPDKIPKEYSPLQLERIIDYNAMRPGWDISIGFRASMQEKRVYL